MIIQYEDYSKLIQKGAWKFYKQYGRAIRRDFQEFEAIGNLAFCKARTHYNANISAFSTYLTRWVHCEMIQFVRREIRHCYTVDMDGIPERIDLVGDSLRFVEFKCGLTDDGAHVVDLATHKNGRLFKKSVAESLVQNGWQRRRIKNAMAEVKRALAIV